MSTWSHLAGLTIPLTSLSISIFLFFGGASPINPSIDCSPNNLANTQLLALIYIYIYNLIQLIIYKQNLPKHVKRISVSVLDKLVS